MEEEKIILSNAEKELMSLAHEILRSRNRMDIIEIRKKATSILKLTSSTKDEDSSPFIDVQETPSALEKELQQPIKEATFREVDTPFVESLFEGSNTDYQRVMSMLKTKENAEEALAFIEQQIRPDYDWSAKKEEVESFLVRVTHLYD